MFAFVSNFEKAPQYSSYWKVVKLKEREGNSATYETESEAEGRKIKSVTRVVAQGIDRMVAETIDGDGKGTKISFNFQSVPEGTQLTLDAEIVLPGFARMLGGLVKSRIESGMQEELGIIKKMVEKS